MTTRYVALCVFLFVAVSSASSYTISSDSIYHHIEVLAHDSLEGRMVGDAGEMKAARYISAIFREAGMQPLDSSYLIAFDFIRQVDLGRANHLSVNGVALKLDEEFQPMIQSASVAFSHDSVVFADYGITATADDGEYDDYEGVDVTGKAVVIKRFAPSAGDNPHVDFEPYSSLTSKIQNAIDRGAGMVLFYTPAEHDDTISTQGFTRVTPKDIPIIFLRRAAIERLGLDLEHPAISSISGEVELINTRDTGFNVAAQIPGRTDTAVIIGAHYDHLGWGGPSSRYLGEEKKIHPGADDNGSGTSALIELARQFAARPEPPHYTLQFVSFSGEEQGLLGSSSFVKTMPTPAEKIRMMVNMDMVGRLAEQNRELVVFGTGTTEAFTHYFDSLAYDSLVIISKSSGVGPSDHTAFYNRGIPVLHFFTGAHNDYHKPEDVVEKIDAPGIVSVTRVVTDLVDYFDTYAEPLAFQKTKNGMTGRSAAYSVTLGIMPDYTAEVRGLKIDGLSPDRPGERAGLLEGDIIIRMGDVVVGDIYDYMNALGQFRKGDTTTVVVERAADTLSLQVVFK